VIMNVPVQTMQCYISKNWGRRLKDNIVMNGKSYRVWGIIWNCEISKTRVNNTTTPYGQPGSFQ
jgi:hypothetical protein